jgi:hypothetical protein
MSTVKIEMSAEEVIALLEAINFRLDYLEEQPMTLKSSQDMAHLREVVGRMLPQISAHAQSARQQERDTLN